jgi:hypothetical protein
MPKTTKAVSPFKRAATNAGGSQKKSPPKPAEPVEPEPEEVEHEQAAPESEATGTANSIAPRKNFYVGLKDLKLPSMKIVAKTGELSEKFKPGSVVVDKSEVLSDGKEPVKFVVLSALRKWIEKKPYKPNPQPEDLPRVVYSEEAVFELGGTLEWEDDEETGQGIPPTWGEALDLTILVENPEEGTGPSAHFPFVFEDTHTSYALVTWSLMNTAFRKAAHKFFSAYALHLREDWTRGGFELTTYTGNVGGNSVICPEVRYGQLCSDEFKEWLLELLPSSSSSDE